MNKPHILCQTKRLFIVHQKVNHKTSLTFPMETPIYPPIISLDEGLVSNGFLQHLD